MRVPILRIPYSDADIKFVKDGVEEILVSGHLTLGPYTRRFEEEFAEFTGSAEAIACSNGTSALELILRGLGIEGKSVIVPTNTFLATAYAVMQSGNRVMFADSDRETMCLGPEDIESRLNDDVAAVILVHIGGIITPKIREISQLCEKRGIYLIEDCAHAHGSAMGGQSAGAFGVAGAFSFFPTKVLTTGEGGMVTTDDPELAGQIRMIRNHGKNPDLGNRMSVMASNFRISEITALLGCEQMRRADEIIKARREVAARYDDALENMVGLTPMSLSPNLVSSYYKYIVWLDPSLDRLAVKKRLRDEYGVSLTGEIYADLCHTEPIWTNFTQCGAARDHSAVACGRYPACGCTVSFGSFPGAEYASKHHICLPLYPGLGQEEVRHVADSLRAVVEPIPA